MSTHKAPPARGRRRSGGPAPAPVRDASARHAATRGRRLPLWGGVAALTVLSAAGLAAVAWTPSDPDTPRAESPAPPERQRDRTTPTASRDDDPSPSASPSDTAPAESDIPRTGPGTFTTAPGTSAKVGTGTALRYRVDVEDGLDLSATDAAGQIERILADRRGWTADGHSAFQRVADGPTDFVVRIATPGTVDDICGQYGLDTGGEVNCNVGDDVMVNLKRWLLATPVYADDVPAYRALIINHEVGHFLGHGHVTCPGEGQPAPAMMQQIKGMHGCAPNVWPYDEHGNYLTGPAVP
ncbi:DUF3152 domain-containing protein [Streptomyces flavalbus]|uniref:DUF3152 domain-containing protein n=1 Tax=Streptomyces flavalbus TaxID=2665155 RepID=A0ABW2W048_9ACTN